MNSDILSPAELDAIRGRCEAATADLDLLDRAAFELSRRLDRASRSLANELWSARTAESNARADIPRLLAHVAALGAMLSTAARELELSCYTDEAVTYQANKQRRLDLAARIRALTPQPTQEPQP